MRFDYMKKFYGNKYTVGILNNMIKNKCAAHSVIFYGENGCGKKMAANYYTSQLLCENNIEGKSCGVCKSCRNTADMTHPDVTYVQTEGKLKGYSVKTIHAVIRDSFIKPNNNTGKKIYIFRDCSNMSIQSQNMLLKLIEEPPDYAYFIFTAESKYEFLPTIISRCICLAVNICTIPEAETALTEIGYKSSDISDATECFQGNIGRCIEYIENKDFRQKVELTKNIAESILNCDEYKLNFLLTSAGSEKNEFKVVLSMLDNIIGDSAVFSSDKYSVSRCCSRDSAVMLSEILTMRQILIIHEKIEGAVRAVESNVSISLSAASLCAEIMRVLT